MKQSGRRAERSLAIILLPVHQEIMGGKTEWRSGSSRSWKPNVSLLQVPFSNSSSGNMLSCNSLSLSEVYIVACLFFTSAVSWATLLVCLDGIFCHIRQPVKVDDQVTSGITAETFRYIELHRFSLHFPMEPLSSAIRSWNPFMGPDGFGHGGRILGERLGSFSAGTVCKHDQCKNYTARYNMIWEWTSHRNEIENKSFSR